MLNLCFLVGLRLHSTYESFCSTKREHFIIIATYIFLQFSFFSDTSCLPGQFRCSEGTCIPSLAVCNYQKDCEKGDDELQGCCKYAYIG